MSAPVTERGRTAVRGRTAAIPAQRDRTDGVVTVPAAPTSDPAAAAGPAARRSAQQKAYARRDERVRRLAGLRPERTAAAGGRPQFVLLIMVLLAVGLVATLWLSTAAAADSYRLQDATAEARVLSEQAERLKQEVAVLASAPELARRAGELGMLPVRDPARLVVGPDGSVDIVGQPRAVVPPPPPAPPAPPADAQPPAPEGTEGAAPDGTAPNENATPNDAAPNETAPDETAPDETAPDNSTERGGTAPDDAAQLAAPGAERAEAPGVDGGDAPAAAEGGREGESGESAAGRGTGARAGGGGTDAG